MCIYIYIYIYIYYILYVSVLIAYKSIFIGNLYANLEYIDFIEKHLTLLFGKFEAEGRSSCRAAELLSFK